MKSRGEFGPWGVRNARALLGWHAAPHRATPEINVTRLAPGSGCCRVEWEYPEACGSDWRYEVECGPAGASDRGVAATVPAKGDGGAATLTGLSNGSDHEARIVLRDASGRLVSTSPVRLFRCGEVPGVVVNYIHPDDYTWAFSGRSPASPSIVMLPGGAILVSHDVFWGGAGQNLTMIFRSDDGGASFSFVTAVFPCFWGSLFLHRGALYLLGMNAEYGACLIGRSDDEGRTWSVPTPLLGGGHRDTGGPHRAPMPIVAHEGRLWTVIDHGSWSTGGHATGVLSCPADADLLDAAAWTMSACLPYDPAWPGAVIGGTTPGFLEGNVVVSPEGRLLVIPRYQTQGARPSHGLVPLLSLDPGRPAAAPRFERFVGFLGNASKFTIRRHPTTGRYLSLVNRVTGANDSQRNVLSLVSSRDLITWRLVKDVLNYEENGWPEDSTQVGFQYVDWVFDRKDILAVSRTAINGAYNYHNANHITFHRIGGVTVADVPASNFKNSLKSRGSS